MRYLNLKVIFVLRNYKAMTEQMSDVGNRHSLIIFCQTHSPHNNVIFKFTDKIIELT